MSVNIVVCLSGRADRGSCIRRVRVRKDGTKKRDQILRAKEKASVIK